MPDLNLSVPARDLRVGDLIVHARDAVILRSQPGLSIDYTVRDAHLTGGQVFVYVGNNDGDVADIVLNHADVVRIRRVVVAEDPAPPAPKSTSFAGNDIEVPLDGRDIARIFQALCAEADRLHNLRAGWRRQADVDHALELRDRFAAAHPERADV